MQNHKYSNHCRLRPNPIIMLYFFFFALIFIDFGSHNRNSWSSCWFSTDFCMKIFSKRARSLRRQPSARRKKQHRQKHGGVVSFASSHRNVRFDFVYSRSHPTIAAFPCVMRFLTVSPTGRRGHDCLIDRTGLPAACLWRAIFFRQNPFAIRFFIFELKRWKKKQYLFNTLFKTNRLPRRFTAIGRPLSVCVCVCGEGRRVSSTFFNLKKKNLLFEIFECDGRDEHSPE